jgi:hypothetical protein
MAVTALILCEGLSFCGLFCFNHVPVSIHIHSFCFLGIHFSNYLSYFVSLLLVLCLTPCYTFVCNIEEGSRYGENLLADFKVEDGTGFRNFVRMTPTDFAALLRMFDCKISSFNVFSLVHILNICLGGSSRQTDDVFRNKHLPWR